jgi:hypothetical protein
MDSLDKRSKLMKMDMKFDEIMTVAEELSKQDSAGIQMEQGWHRTSRKICYSLQ